ncbi:phage holin family protein [Arthrospiribacter ruber]|uniref:Uncharacterized protein n=1 Tax=Arthrospiribacter ruber TaxID=2487934 RepID=A0A951MDI9_9BACT|nr:phage holin family protein [Arthrospiribacter ruber]MBW3469089.1 hypothetical protein [Arthrospiribacter ruber]
MWGFDSFLQFIKTWFRFVETTVLHKYFIPVILAINFVFEWVFVSVGGIYFLIVLYILDFLTGVGRSLYFSYKISFNTKHNLPIPKKYIEKKLVSKKFPRFLITMLSTVILLGILKLAGVYSAIFLPLFSIFYSVFLGQQIISITENLHDVGIVGGKIYERLKRKITEYLD